MNIVKGKRKNHKVYPGIKGRRPDLKAIRQQEAKERQEAYVKLTVQEKLDRLDMMFGKNTGSTKQRSRLTAQLTPTKQESVA